MTKKYGVSEVSRHNQASDLWIALHGKVYDVTKFLKEHPGGEEVLLNLAGQDATKCFDDIGHSQVMTTFYQNPRKDFIFKVMEYATPCTVFRFQDDDYFLFLVSASLLVE